MKPWTLATLNARLERSGYTLIKAPEEAALDPTPWFIRVLVGGGAWLAALFIAGGTAGLLGLSSGKDHGVVFSVLGLLYAAAACGLRGLTRGDFLRQFCLAGILAGQVLLGVGLTSLFHSQGDSVVRTALLVMTLVTLLVYRDTLHRFLATTASGVLVTLLLREGDLASAAAPILGLLLTLWAWLPSRALVGAEAILGPLQRPILHGLAMVSLLPHGLGIFSSREIRIPALTLVATTLLLALVAGRILRRLKALSPRSLLLTLLGLSVLVGAGAWVSGIPAVALVMVLAVERREPGLFAVACAAGLGFLSHFYYSLEITLLAKSGLLLASGALLLVLRRFLTREASPC